MANILLTNVCNRNCAYCFARGRISLTGGDAAADGTADGTVESGGPAGGSPEGRIDEQWMTEETLDRILDFYDPGPKIELGLLGGEPTLHPRFTALLDRVRKRGHPVRVFTNGLIRQSVRDELEQRGSEGGIKVILNVNQPAERNPGEDRELRKTLAQLHRITNLGYTLSRPDSELEFLLRLIEEFDLVRVIRLGLAMPIHGQSNSFLELRDYIRAAARVAGFSRQCDHERVFLKLDCGFTLCMFSEEQIGTLFKSGTPFQSLCMPIPDIDCELNVWHCFPLSRQGRFHLDQFSTPLEMMRELSSRFAEYSQSGIYEECRYCRHFHRRYCAGGCIAHAIRHREQGSSPSAPASMS